MATLILDPGLERECRDRHPDCFTECWDGVRVVSPVPNDEHQDIQAGLLTFLYTIVQREHRGVVRGNVNLTNRRTKWAKNYRVPDLACFLEGSAAINRGSHWFGGADFLVEIISEGEEPHAKLDFYAGLGNRELLIVERDPWALELFRLKDGTLASTGRCDVDSDRTLNCESLGLTFRLESGSAAAH